MDAKSATFIKFSLDSAISCDSQNLGLDFAKFVDSTNFIHQNNYQNFHKFPTQKFTIAKYGLIRRDTIEMLNGKVESIRVRQRVIGRVLNYGDIVIVGAGGSSSPIRFIDAPLEFRRQLVYVQDEGSKGK